jgi:nucleotide-binding universal stress UspA family protein
MEREAMPARRRAIERILVGTDFSRPAANAVLRAAMLAAEHSARLEIVHVTPRIDRSRSRRLGLGGAALMSANAALEAHLAGAQDLAGPPGVVSTVRLLKGSAPELLAREATRLSADLLVLGYRGERTVRDALVGTTAERVLERWAGDTLIVRSAPRAPYATILACVALGPVSCSVLRSAVALSEQARLHLLHAYEPPFEMKLVSHHLAGATLARHRAAARAEAVQGLAELLERCPVPSGRHFERHLRHGEPSRLIPGAAVRHGADVVVVGKNQSMLEAFFLGSITKKIVRSARTDVLVSDAR